MTEASISKSIPVDRNYGATNIATLESRSAWPLGVTLKPGSPTPGGGAMTQEG